MSNDTDDVLEKNVSHLLEGGGEPPRLADLSRAKIRAQLLARHGRDAKKRSPIMAVGFGLVAAAAAAAVITRIAGGGGAETRAADPSGTLADGSTWLVESGAKVSVLGPRHVRVEGAALLDVAPGKGVFIVETAQGRIEVLGTKFFVAAEATRTTAAVVRGKVKLASDAGDVILHAGEQGVAEHARPPTRGPAPRLSYLVSWAAQARQQRGAEGRDNNKDVQPIHHGTLFAKDPGIRSHPPWGDEYPLPMKQLKVDVVVENQVARVALDQTFHNDEDQALEGTYRFAIPSDAALQRLAMYVDGKLMESAVVERMQARRIYEELVYRRVDPALLEWAGTGRLNLRIYPIPARQDKRLMLAYTQSLPKLYEDWTLTVPLPEIDQPVGDLAFDVRVKGCGSCELSSTSHQISSRKDGDDAVISYHKTGEKIGDSLVIHVRDQRTQVQVAATTSGDERYLMVRAPSEIHVEPHAYRPRTWVILDDVSASRHAMERTAQADMIDAFLRELDEDDRVAVVAFDVATREILAPTRVMDVDRKAVRAALKAEGGVGATDFGAALDRATKLLTGVSPDDAMIVYLGDGVITSGVRKLDTLRAQLKNAAHFVGVGVGDGPDTQTLDALAGATGGFATTIDLSDDVAWRTFDLVAALHTARVTDVEARLVDDKGALVPSATYVRSAQLADGEEIELVSRLAGAGTPVAVELTGTGSSDKTPWKQRIALAGTPTAGQFVPRLWAQRHIAARLLAKHEPVTVPVCTAQPSATRGVAKATCSTEAEVREARDEGIRKEVIGLGKKYFLLSRHTSLLVLENDAMYAQYGVTKGAGDTWAPYAMPAKIPVVVAPIAAVPVSVAQDAELVRAPLPVFYDYSGYGKDFDGDVGGVGGADIRWGTRGTGMGPMAVGAASRTRADLGLADVTTVAGQQPVAEASEHAAATTSAREPEMSLDEGKMGKGAAQRDSSQDNPLGNERVADKQRAFITTEELGVDPGFGRNGLRGGGGGEGYFQVALGKSGGYGWIGQQVSLMHFTHPNDQSFDDVTAWIPALLRDGFDGWRRELRRIGGDGHHAIDPAASELLTKARAQLPSGVYRWDDFEIAVDSARRVGWRRITDAGLQETASFDGTTWTRRYAELGLDVTRTLTDDDVALDLAMLPILVAEPAHWARWFEVSLKGPRQIALGTKLRTVTKTLFVIELDAQYRVASITDGDGKQLVEITWPTGSGGPTAAHVLGGQVEVGFTAQAVGDATAWAHQATPAQPVVIELPVHLVAYSQDKVKTQATGSATWRHAQRQLMATYAATRNRNGLATVYAELLSHGGALLGDLALASAGLATATTDKDFATALAPFGTAPDREVLARYLFASRAYRRDGNAATLAHSRANLGHGLVAQLFALREASAQLAAGKGKAAVDTLLTIDGRATQLRVIGAAMTQNRYDVKPEDLARAWENAAIGPMKNVARGQAAMAMWNRGMYDAGAERIAQLVADLDLHALPPHIEQAQYMFNSSRRGAAGWQIVWAMWRERVIANGDYDHVMALLPAAQQNPNDVQAILARAAVLAGDDVDRRVTLARIAVSRGQGAWAQTLLDPMLKTRPNRDLYQLAASLALAQGRQVEALALLESAQDAAGDEAVDLTTVRRELGQIISVAHQIAVMQPAGAVRDSAVKRALAWGTRWRAIDEGNPMIDQQLGELLLAIGDASGAWRQLSTVIERDPMVGRGYTLVAEAFERQGRVADALEYWQQAIVIDQTDPTPRLRKAQALIALGRTADGDALLREIGNRSWHDMWSNVVWQAKGLIDRGKPHTGFDE